MYLEYKVVLSVCLSINRIGPTSSYPIIFQTVGILLANGDGRKHFQTNKVGGSGWEEDPNSLNVNVYPFGPPSGRQYITNHHIAELQITSAQSAGLSAGNI